MAGPIVGGFVTQSYLGWRWTAWLTLFFGAFNFTVALILVPETYAPVLLKRRANKLRFETKNWALHAKIEENRTTLSKLGTRYAFRPIQMLILEPILLLITIYMSLIYGVWGYEITCSISDMCYRSCICFSKPTRSPSKNNEAGTMVWVLCPFSAFSSE